MIKDVEYEYDIAYDIPLNMIKDVFQMGDLLWELAFPPPEGTKSKGPVYYTWAG